MFGARASPKLARIEPLFSPGTVLLIDGEHDTLRHLEYSWREAGGGAF